MAEPTLTARALNRALLARQLLLERSTLGVTDVLEQMGGIQMQYAPAAYIGLWSRMRDFARPILTQALEERRAIQATIMRVTIHTVSASDYWRMIAGVRQANREWFARTQRALGGIDMEALADAARVELADGPLRMSALNERLVSRGFPDRAANWAGFWVDLVRVPPSGTWERRRADLYGIAERWLPCVEVSEEEGIEHLVRRYLGAFGPAPIRDVANWMGVNVGRIRPVAEGMDLRVLRDENGGRLLDLPDAPLPDPETPAPPRFLAVWDAMLLVHARRTQVLPEEYRSLVFNTRTPQSSNTFLLDGQVAGTWRFDGRIELSPFRRLTDRELGDLQQEADRLAAFHAD